MYSLFSHHSGLRRWQAAVAVLQGIVGNVLCGTVCLGYKGDTQLPRASRGMGVRGERETETE